MFTPVRLLATCIVLSFIVTGCTRNRVETTPTPTTALPGQAAVATLATLEPGVTAQPDQAGTPQPDTAASGTGAANSGAASSSGAAPGGQTSDLVQTVQYEVQVGDTLDTIAVRFDTDPETIGKLNRLATLSVVPGQRLIVPLVEPTPEPTGEPVYYTVQAGDTLSAIAERFGVKPSQILAANKLSDPDNVPLGKRLIIPEGDPAAVDAGEGESASSGEDASSSETSADPGSAATHIVQPGEGLLDIAALYGISSNELAAVNGIANPNLLRVGQKLVLPGLTLEEAKRARSILHVVQSGETLISIAEQYGISAEALAIENNLTNPNSLIVGQELLIPQ